MIPSGIENASFRLVDQCFNQVRHRVHPTVHKRINICSYSLGLYRVFHNERPNFKTLYFCKHENQMNETCTT
jgi:hypothetical protein